MRRRQFITLLGGAAAAWPLAAGAQQTGKVARIGFLGPSIINDPSSMFIPLYQALLAQLRVLGFNEGQNLVVTYGAVDDPRGLPVVATDAAFATLAQMRNTALLVAADPLFFTRVTQLVVLSARHAIPTLYSRREFAAAGGLISYGPNIKEDYRVLGVYAARILKGEKPGDLPIQRTTKFELVINLSTATALSLEIPDKLLALADEVIE